MSTRQPTSLSGSARYAEPIVIQPMTGWLDLGLSELFRYRELMFFFAWRDVVVRYKQTLLGVLWAVLQPLLTMVVFAALFGGLLGVSTDGLPKPIFYYSGLLVWTYFAGALAASSGSLVGAQNLLKKVYFPRLVLPLSSILAGLVDFSIAFVVLLGLMAYYGIPFSWRIALLPALILVATLTSLAVGLWLAALNVRFRDVRYVVPFLVQLWMFASPVIYPVTEVPEKWRTLYGLNPMAGVVEGFRWCLLGSGGPPGSMFLMSMSMMVLLLLAGLVYFRRAEATFADLV